MNHIDRLNQHITDGTLTRREWTGTDAQGRHTACLLAAMHPKCGELRDPSLCPAEYMPQWLAKLTPWVDDHGSLDQWPAVVRRYAAAAARWGKLSQSAWEQVHQLVRADIVREAMRHTTIKSVLAVCEDIASTLEAGKWPTREQRDAAATATNAASSTAYAASSTAYAAATDAAYAAGAGVDAAADRIIDRILTRIEQACDTAEGEAK